MLRASSHALFSSRSYLPKPTTFPVFWQIHLRNKSEASKKSVAIGTVEKEIKPPNDRHLVPHGYLSAEMPQHSLQNLQWILQKDILGQDIYLIGPPGPARRRLALQYLEMVEKEVEYIALSRDTTESDLKQRREIRSATAHYVDQCAVTAATKGRALILDGMEKAERNVLPILNNLLENREMQLEDGRFLVAPHTYDKLLREHSKETLDQWKLVRVSEDFRVIALGLPVPRYRGNPLDPPLRSRFQSRDISNLSSQDLVSELKISAKNAPESKLTQLVSLALAINTPESSTLGLPDFPLSNLYAAAQILDAFPSLDLSNLVEMLYPFPSFLQPELLKNIQMVFNKFKVRTDEKKQDARILSINKKDQGLDICIKDRTSQHTFFIPKCSQQETSQLINDDGITPFVSNQYHEAILSNMVLSHAAHDFCIIGPKGCGKSVLAQEFGRRMGYTVPEVIPLYQDMTARDFLQQRVTDEHTGDTGWADSPLVTAARQGKLAILDGLHRIHPGTLSVLHSLVHDRHLQLYDGTRLVRADRFDKIKASTGLDEVQLNQRGLYRIHPDFRIVALAEPNVQGAKWLDAEALSLFLFHTLRPLSMKEELHLIEELVSSQPSEAIKNILSFTHKLRSSSNPELQSLSKSMSTRQLLRIARRLHTYPEHSSLTDLIDKACLSRFLPSLPKQALSQAMSESNLLKPSLLKNNVECYVKDGNLYLGGVNTPIYNPGESSVKVPNIVFFDNPQHQAILADMLKDFLLGEHLLLVGNQGVGKNKLVDRLLQLLNRPREYIQLHRDTTVQSLTVVPSVQDGRVVYNDSPLVTAAAKGHVLVIDEADKAPTHVTCLLKGLAESGSMLLADGRRIVSPSDSYRFGDKKKIVTMHPDFRMIVLANRPGFPFLGNDFFGSLGDIFSCHAVDNPSPESELFMLQRYGPNVPSDIIRKLQNAFAELRAMVDEGTLSYPYSTRELVSIVKHLEKFPEDSLQRAVKNVFDFDAYNKEAELTLHKTLFKHGIPLGIKTATVNLANEKHLGPPTFISKWSTDSKKQELQSENRPINIKNSVILPSDVHPLSSTECHLDQFSERQCYWSLPLPENCLALDLAISHDDAAKSPFQDRYHVVSMNPFTYLSFCPLQQNVVNVNLEGLFSNLTSNLPSLRLLPLEGNFHGNVLLHEAQSGLSLLLDPSERKATQLDFQGSLFPKIFGSMLSGFSYATSNHTNSSFFQLASMDKPENNNIIFFKQDSILVANLDEMRVSLFTVPFSLSNLHVASPNHWLLKDDSGRCFMAQVKDNHLCQIRSLEPAINFHHVSQSGLPSEFLSSMVQQKIQSPNRLLGLPGSFAAVGIGCPELESPTDIYGFPRSTPLVPKASLSIPMIGQVVNIFSKLPSTEFTKDVPNKSPVHGYLEVVDVTRHACSYLPVPIVGETTNLNNYFYRNLDAMVKLNVSSGGRLAGLDPDGHIHLWDTSRIRLESALGEWMQVLGSPNQKLSIERKSGKDVSAPKHGKVDPSNAPHVGGNTWAGGSGGRDTAGLGGKGGPYRLDSGNPVFQVPQEEKDAVPEHIKKAAREMAQKAYQEKLREIRMSSYDAQLYEKFAAEVRPHIRLLRNILDSLQAKSQERHWLRHQTSGELDDAKLIEGLAGERAIYKRRGDQPPELGSPQLKAKRLRIVADLSGSMYRFNSYDGRLQRQMEALLMVMEAFQGFQDRFVYDIVGHSGETDCLQVTDSKHPPDDNKKRLVALQTMFAHTQYCDSGDHTLPAATKAIKDLSQRAEDFDESFVIILSDANLRRYSINPASFARLLTSDPKVNTFAIFIGSLGDEAERLKHYLPAGRSFVCLQTQDLPRILQQIFTSTVFKS